MEYQQEMVHSCSSNLQTCNIIIIISSQCNYSPKPRSGQGVCINWGYILECVVHNELMHLMKQPSNKKREEKEKIMSVSKYWHERERVGMMLITIVRNATKGVFPLLSQ